MTTLRHPSADFEELRRKGLSDAELAKLIVNRAWEEERRRRPLPRWLPFAARWLPRVLMLATVINGLVGIMAVVAPFLRMALGDAATAPIYAAYSLICPQRASHTDELFGVPMAMEQRMVSMYLIFGLAGALYLLAPRLQRALPTWALILGVAPAAIDVALSTFGIRQSTQVSRWWTGALAAAAVVWWVYPRFEAQLRATQLRMARLLELRADS